MLMSVFMNALIRDHVLVYVFVWLVKSKRSHDDLKTVWPEVIMTLKTYKRSQPEVIIDDIINV